MKIFPFLLLILTCTVSTHAQVFVKHDATGSNDGTSWQNAYTNLDSALSQTASGQIWVAKGTYRPSKSVYQGSPYKSFSLFKPITLLGGFSGVETNVNQRNINLHVTILSGDIGVEEVDNDNTARVVWIGGTNLTNATALDGFTITKAFYSNGMGFSYDNAGVYISGTGTPVVRNCNIRGNSGSDGGGVYVYMSKPLITDNLIINNKATLGAGISLSYSNAIILNNRIIFNNAVGNTSHLAGGGIQIGAYCAPVISGNLIENNYAEHFGGGISYEGNYQATVINNVISNNRSREGGGLYIDGTGIEMLNNLVVNNYASLNGGGLMTDYSPENNMINNTITNNVAGNKGGAAYLLTTRMTLLNNVIYDNKSSTGKPIVFLTSRSDWFPKFSYCNIKDGSNGMELPASVPLDSIWRTGNISLPPKFLDTLNYNFQLDALSPCINTGTPDTANLHLPPTDLAGNARVINGRIEMGCYEFTGGVGAYFKATPNRVDLAGWRDSSFTLNVLGTGNWQIYDTANWINASPMEGNGNASVLITAMANPNLTDARTSRLLLSGTATNIPSIPIIINQSSGTYFIAPDTIYINGNANDTAVFNINSNVFWYFTGYPSWLQLTTSQAATGTDVVAKATTANATGNTRQGLIISQYGATFPLKKDTIIIIQLLASSKLCPGSSTQFAAGISGTTYQWEVDTGTGFTTLSNNSNYSGVTTSVLGLNNMPASFYGYRYRCHVNAAYSNIYSIQFENTWTGAVSTAWENPANWSCGSLPDSNTDVVINNGAVTINVSTMIRRLTIANAATLTVLPGVNLNILH